ncbi:MAG: hypothetical protein IPP55_02025 [Anaerolineales bacterium]|nr:hypothetical protein [Anaerolineales bacterium]
MKSNLSKLLAILMVLMLSACNFGGATPDATEAPAIDSPVATEAPATEAPIVHTTIPSEPAETIGNASDNDEINSAENKDVNFGDDFKKTDMNVHLLRTWEYLPEIDIVNFSIGEDDNFFMSP